MLTYIRFKMRLYTKDTIIIRENRKIFRNRIYNEYRIYNDILIFVILINDINGEKQLLFTYVPV